MLILGSNSQRVKSSCQYEKSNEKENRTEGVIFSYRFGWSRGLVKKKKKKNKEIKKKKRGVRAGGGTAYLLKLKIRILLCWFGLLGLCLQSNSRSERAVGLGWSES